jgi:hypothetical protein
MAQSTDWLRDQEMAYRKGTAQPYYVVDYCILHRFVLLPKGDC